MKGEGGTAGGAGGLAGGASGLVDLLVEKEFLEEEQEVGGQSGWRGKC